MSSTRAASSAPPSNAKPMGHIDVCVWDVWRESTAHTHILRKFGSGGGGGVVGGGGMVICVAFAMLSTTSSPPSQSGNASERRKIDTHR